MADREVTGLAGPESVVVMSQPEYRDAWRRTSDEDVLQSFIENTVVLEIDGVKYEVFPDRDSSNEGPCPSGYVVSAVCGPVTTVWERLLADRDWLLDDFEEHWLRAHSAWCVDARRVWVEPAMFVDTLLHEVSVGDFDSRFFAHCRRRGIPFVVRIEGPRYTVISTHNEEELLSVSYELRRVEELCRVDDGGQVCELYGGPWTSASRAAASMWFQRRTRLVAAYGCSVCGGQEYALAGQIYTGSPIISLVKPSVPTRWLRAETE